MKVRRSYLSLRKKVIGMFILIFMTFVVLGALWFQKSTAAIRNNTANFSQQIIEQMNSRLDTYFEEIESVSLPLTSHPATAQLLNYKKESGPYERLLVSRQLEQAFKSIMLGRQEINGISIVSESNIAVSNLSFLSAEERFAKYMQDLPTPGKFKIMGIARVGDYPSISLAMKFYSANSHNLGLLIIDLRVNKIKEVISKMELGESGYAWISDANGHYLYHPDESKWNKEIPAAYRSLMQSPDETRGTGQMLINGMQVTYSHSSETNLMLFSEVPLRELDRELVAIRNITIIIGFVALFISLFALMSVFFSLSNSILLLQSAMKRVENGNLDIQVSAKKKNEIGDLYKRFNSMVEEIKKLVRTVGDYQLKEKELEIKQKDSKLQALQYQINPHFLFNTLEVINAYALVDDMKHISRIVNALARLFRYNIEYHAKTVPLSIEIARIKDYLNIQLERFEKLRVEIEIEENDASQVIGMPLIIQPLLENAFKHGYQKHKLEPVYISIVGEPREAGYEVFIQDRGYGMDQITMESFNNLFENMSNKGLYEHNQLGLWNVHSRIRLAFGQPYGLKIIRSDQDGTVIRIILPYEKNIREVDAHVENHHGGR